MIDLDAYFRRIDYSGPHSARLATLRELHSLHPQAIAFELSNSQLSIHSLNGKTDKRTLASAGEMRDVLTDLFKLRLSDLEGLDPVLARLATATP